MAYIIQKVGYGKPLFVKAIEFEHYDRLRPFFDIVHKPNKATRFKTKDLAKAAMNIFLLHDKNPIQKGEWKVIDEDKLRD